MAKKLMLFCILALGLAAPAQAGEWKELRVRGVVVSASAEVVAVENAVGDATLMCLVPERLAEKAATFKPGDEVRMICARKRGQKAMLVKLERLGERSERRHDKHEQSEPGETHDHDEDEDKDKDEKGEHEERSEKRASATARGLVVELAETAIVVQDAESGRRLACRVPSAKAHKLEGVKLGDRVEIHCAGKELAYLKRPHAEGARP